MMTKPWEAAINGILNLEKVRLTKKEIMESIKINEDDYNYIVLNILPEIDETWNKLIKKYFNHTKEELLDVDNIDLCYKFYIYKYTPVDYKKGLHNFNILNPVVSDLIYFKGLDANALFTKLCDLNDNELFYVLQNFVVRFYSLIVYLVAKQIKINNINDEHFKSWYIDEEFIWFIKCLLDEGCYDLSIKRLDFISDINKFFKIKNIDQINVSKVRSKDEILCIIISKLFRVIFYKVLFDLNIRNKLEEANLINDTYDIIEELYDYFYRKVFITMSGEFTDIENEEPRTIIPETDIIIDDEIFVSDEWEE